MREEAGGVEAGSGMADFGAESVAASVDLFLISQRTGVKIKLEPGISQKVI